MELKKVYGGLELTGTLKDDVDLNQTSQYFCSQVKDIEYIGARVTKERKCVTLIRYKDELYSEKAWSGCGAECTIEFTKFSEKFEDTEPLENYRYCIDYCNPAIDDEVCIFWYYKADELEEAKKQQRDLGEELAFLEEIK